MDLSGRTVALYGRFSPGTRDRLQDEIVRMGGEVTRDLTRRSDLFIVGSLATPLIDSGALGVRLQTARDRGVAVCGEQAFEAELEGEAPTETTLPLATALAQSKLTGEQANVLAAFDLITLAGHASAFGDVATMRTTADLLAQGSSLGEAVAIQARARDRAPRGRRKIVLTGAGEAALRWDDGGTTSLEGQGYLPLDEAHPSIEDLFEAAALAEAAGDADEAARLYDQCARADRSDAIAPYNYANLRLAGGAHDEAILAYRRALERDPKFSEARYNLAQALEAAGKPDVAADELRQLLQSDPTYADALFNFAQLQLKSGAFASAKALYERYLTLEPPEAWADVARKAIAYCVASLLLR